MREGGERESDRGWEIGRWERERVEGREIGLKREGERDGVGRREREGGKNKDIVGER